MNKIGKAVCDTAVLILTNDDFEITNPDSFTPSAKLIFGNTGNKTVSAYCNPSKKDLLEHNYRPCITLTKSPRVGGMSLVLKISASLPRLIHGNNLLEVCDQDFAEIIDRLQWTLKDVGVLVSKSALVNARICSMHYSKNLELDGIDCASIIQELERSEVHRSLDVGRSDYRNGGHCIRLHTNSFEFAVYDKLEDFRKGLISDKRAFEKDAAYQNININTLKGKNILRIESRLNSSACMRKIFSKAGVEVNDLTLSELFSSSISQKVNEYFWLKAVESRKALALSKDDAEALFKKLIAQHKPLHALELMGLWITLKHCGVREVKHLLRKSPTIPKLIKELKKIETDGDWMSDVFEEVYAAIKKNNMLIL